ncbi:MAG TPA: hypothetical protein QF353_03265 [Gammaproteobacteria bacterium]|nr:hypothetical protein [Gammaproteobacteria bacterium]
MAKKNDDEYTFGSGDKAQTEEYTAAAHSGSTENLRSILSNRKVILPLGLLIIFYGGSKLFSREVEKPKKEPEVVVDTPRPVEVKPAAPQIVHVVPDTGLKDSVGDLRTSYEDQQQKVSGLQDAYGQLSYQMKGVNQQLHSITMQLNTINAQLARKPVPKKEVKKVVKLKPTYFIKAIVDGRAWVRNLQNNTLTVAVGDMIPKYGKVTGIYPEEGFITTASGRVVRFSNYAN